MLCSTLLPYQNALTDPLLRCPIALYPSAFDHPSPPSPATQQASRAHDKRDLYNTCIVSQLSRNKYCLNQLCICASQSAKKLSEILCNFFFSASISQHCKKPISENGTPANIYITHYLFYYLQLWHLTAFLSTRTFQLHRTFYKWR